MIVAQLEEHLPDTQGVLSSNLKYHIKIHTSVGSLTGRTPGNHSGSASSNLAQHSFHTATVVAQLEERMPVTHEVASSNLVYCCFFLTNTNM
ncbi:hypothetical protein KAOT1_13747 [Kordia algicida OT-1]|uniref:Uncharacterized protein n=1 Tax=Kordia algicida OT-1 TaxID=391587 RepID=A9DKA2_9FLAO|nr:hypothetical protein KAOT1_13747 [Kordia algicida OT-1]